jgi:hypothetical protein
MFDVQVFGVSAVLAIMTIVRLLQDLGLPKKFSPIVSVGLGILTGVFLVDPQDLQQGLIDGFYLGLSAIGVHSGVKNVKEGVLNLIEQAKSAKQAKDAKAIVPPTVTIAELLKDPKPVPLPDPTEKKQ